METMNIAKYTESILSYDEEMLDVKYIKYTCC